MQSRHAPPLHRACGVGREQASRASENFLNIVQICFKKKILGNLCIFFKLTFPLPSTQLIIYQLEVHRLSSPQTSSQVEFTLSQSTTPRHEPPQWGVADKPSDTFGEKGFFLCRYHFQTDSWLGWDHVSTLFFTNQLFLLWKNRQLYFLLFSLYRFSENVSVLSLFPQGLKVSDLISPVVCLHTNNFITRPQWFLAHLSLS